jgi:lipopolysaccharide export system protein LptC
MDPTRRLLDRLVAWAPVLMLGGLAALTYWLDAQVQPPTERRDGSSRHEPDVFLENFRAITFDAAGKPRETLAAQRAEHFPDDDSAQVTRPDLALTEPGRPTVTVQADKARISGDRENGWFEGDVRVHREAESPTPGDSTPNGPVTLTTQKLHVVPKQYRVDTDLPVTIEEPRGIIRGRGMTLDNKTKMFTLRSNVSGTFQPKAAQPAPAGPK